MSRTKRNARITAVEAAERDKAVAPKQRAAEIVIFDGEFVMINDSRDYMHLAGFGRANANALRSIVAREIASAQRRALIQAADIVMEARTCEGAIRAIRAAIAAVKP